MQESVYKLVDGQHASAVDCKERMDVLLSRTTDINVEAQSYLKELEQALHREQDLEANLKSFRVGLQNVESWFDSCQSLFTGDGTEDFLL